MFSDWFFASNYTPTSVKLLNLLIFSISKSQAIFRDLNFFHGWLIDLLSSSANTKGKQYAALFLGEYNDQNRLLSLHDQLHF